MMTYSNGDAWGKNMVDYIRRNWLILIALFSIAVWVGDVRAGTKDRYTGTQAKADLAKMELLIQQSVQNIEVDIAMMQGDIAVIRSKVEHLEEEDE